MMLDTNNLFWSLGFRILNLFDPILRSGGACVLVFATNCTNTDFKIPNEPKFGL